MTRTSAGPTPRAGRALGVLATLIASAGLAFMPFGPAPAYAADPSASPSDAVQSIAPDPSVSPTPSDATPSPSSDVTPSPAPSRSPSDQPTPSAAPSDSPTPSPTPSATATPTPAPSVSSTPTPPTTTIDGAGGAASWGDVTLDVPAGIVTAPVSITFGAIAGPPPTDIGPVLSAFTVDAWDGSGNPAAVPAANLSVSVDHWALGGATPDELTIAVLEGTTWRALPTSVSGTTLQSVATVPGVYGIVVGGATPSTAATLVQDASAPSEGLRRVDPGSRIAFTVHVVAKRAISSGDLVETLPAGWQVEDDGGAARAGDGSTNTLTWAIRKLAGGTDLRRSFTAIAPDVPGPDGSLEISSTFGLRLDITTGSAAAAGLSLLVAPRVAIASYTLGRISIPGTDPFYLPANTPVADQQRFDVFRARFELENPDDLSTGISPLLEFKGPGDAAFRPVPAYDASSGFPFYVTREWTPTGDTSGGTELGPVLEPAVPAEASNPGFIGPSMYVARPSAVDATDETTVTPGDRAMGENPAPWVDLTPGERTIVEFSLRATVDAAYLASYQFRVTDAGEAFAGASLAQVTMGGAPPVELTPGQRTGTAGDSAGANVPRYALTPAPTGSMAVLASVLARPSAAMLAPAAAPADTMTVHSGEAMLQGDCAVCHASHSAKGPNLDVETTQSALCVTCHRPAGGAADIVSTSGGTVSPNDPATRSYFSHPLDATGHTTDGPTDGLSGQLNRHSTCADCHQPHRSSTTGDGTTGTDASGNETTWVTSGRLAGAYGAEVTGFTTAGPTYALRVSSGATPEYEVCFKCHSSYTQQLPNNAAHPSRDRTDLAVEFDSSSASFHPLEAPGTNQTTAMTTGLQGTSPYKLWRFASRSVIRCENCHGDGRRVAGATDGSIAASSSLSVHASPNRGILLAPYEDRSLKAAFAAYSSGDFALCYLCHAEAPFVDASGNVRNDTNFRFHGLHVSGLQNMGSGSLSIDDTTGAGRGDALCAECHFRIHGTAQAVGGEDTSNTRLVNFAPDVTAGTDGTTRKWVLATDGSSGTCTLTCHGAPHTNAYYDANPATVYSVTLAISAPIASFTSGDTSVPLMYRLSNVTSTSLPVSVFTVTPTTPGAIGCTTEATTLAAGDATTCTGSYAIQPDDTTGGSLTVRASASDGTYQTNVARFTMPMAGTTSGSGPAAEPAVTLASIFYAAVRPAGVGPWNGRPLQVPDLIANFVPDPEKRSTVRGARKTRA